MEENLKDFKAGITAEDGFFTPISNTKPWFKAAFEGFAGSGKTFTAGLVAVGLHKKIGSQKPVVIFDTEKAAKFLKPMFATAGIEVLVRDSRSLADLKETMKRCREGLADILVIDSISHVWEDFLRSYQEKTHHTRLEFQDWGIVKPTWKKEFSEPFVGDPCHIIMCGRAGYEYENEINEETGKREIYKSGVKMRVEGETAYEPDLLGYLERFEEILGDNKKVWRQITILKDRADVIDGKTFVNPTFADFEPTINVMLAAPAKLSTVAEKDAADLVRTEEEKYAYRQARTQGLEEIEGYLISVWPGQDAKSKKLKNEAIHTAFNTYSWTAVTQMSPQALKDGLQAIREFVKKVIDEEQKAMVTEAIGEMKAEGSLPPEKGSVPKKKAK